MSKTYKKPFAVPIVGVAYLLKYSYIDYLIKSINRRDAAYRKKPINIYIDMMHVLSRIFMPQERLRILNKAIKDQDDYLLSRSVLYLVNHYLRFFKKYKFQNYNIYIFTESGPSLYHTKLNANYKTNRLKRRRKYIEVFATEDLYKDKDPLQMFQDLLYKNKKYLNTLINNIDHCHYFYSEELEMDFIPAYIMSKKNGTFKNIIFSSDKDHMQCIDQHTFLLKKTLGKGYHYYHYSNMSAILSSYKPEPKIKGQLNKYISFIQSLIGDTSDNIGGISRWGYSSSYRLIYKMLSQKLIDTREDFCPKIFFQALDQIIDKEGSNSKYEILLANKAKIETNFKMIDYKELIKTGLDQKQKSRIDSRLKKTFIDIRKFNDQELEQELQQLAQNEKSLYDGIFF